MARVRSSDYQFDADYYAVLGVESNASPETIRREYKRLALAAHPDKNPGRRDWVEGKIRELNAAYEVLSNESRRSAFDQFLRASGGLRGQEEPFFLRRRTPGARALLILHYFVRGKTQEAVGLLEEMEEEHGGEFLCDYLAYSDYLDCLFLLAEYHVSNKNYLAAAQRLRTFYHHECQALRPRHYLNQVVDLLRDLYLRKFPRMLEPSLQVTYLTEAGEFRLGRKDEALRLRLLAEAAARSGDRTVANAAVEQLRFHEPDSLDLLRLEELLDSCVDRDAKRRRRNLRPNSAGAGDGGKG